jgi:hypothetical protein
MFVFYVPFVAMQWSIQFTVVEALVFESLDLDEFLTGGVFLPVHLMKNIQNLWRKL